MLRIQIDYSNHAKWPRAPYSIGLFRPIQAPSLKFRLLEPNKPKTYEILGSEPISIRAIVLVSNHSMQSVCPPTHPPIKYSSHISQGTNGQSGFFQNNPKYKHQVHPWASYRHLMPKQRSKLIFASPSFPITSFVQYPLFPYDIA